MCCSSLSRFHCGFLSHHLKQRAISRSQKKRGGLPRASDPDSPQRKDPKSDPPTVFLVISQHKISAAIAPPPPLFLSLLGGRILTPNKENARITYLAVYTGRAPTSRFHGIALSLCSLSLSLSLDFYNQRSPSSVCQPPLWTLSTPFPPPPTPSPSSPAAR